MHDVDDLGKALAFGESNQSGNRRRRSFSVVAMARRAVLRVQRLSALSSGVGREAAGPGKIVRIDVIQSSLGIEGLAAPLGAAVEPGKDDGRAIDPKRHELSFASKRRELIERPGVNLGRP